MTSITIDIISDWTAGPISNLQENLLYLYRLDCQAVNCMPRVLEVWS